MRPGVDQRGESADPAVWVIRRALAVGFPRDVAVDGDLETRAAFPPCIPQAAQVFAGIGRRLFVQAGRKKARSAEQHGLGGFALFLEQSKRRALGEQAHLQGVPAISERLGRSLEQCGIAAVGVGSFQKPGGLEVRTVDGGFVEKAFDGTRGKVFQRGHATPGMCDGYLALRAAEGVRELHFGDHHLRHFAMVDVADEILPRPRTEDDMQHDITKRRVHGMPVRFPRA